MPSISLRLTGDDGSCMTSLPEILRTANGTVLIEIQGVVNVGDRPLIRTELDIDQEASHAEQSDETITLGSLDVSQIDETGWPVRLLVGENQLLVGHVQKLAFPLAVIQTSAISDKSQVVPVTEVVTHKLVFNKRPEPVVS